MLGHGRLSYPFTQAQQLKHGSEGVAERHYESPKTKMYAPFAYSQTNVYSCSHGGVLA